MYRIAPVEKRNLCSPSTLTIFNPYLPMMDGAYFIIKISFWPRPYLVGVHLFCPVLTLTYIIRMRIFVYSPVIREYSKIRMTNFRMCSVQC